jgi:hypothetical protein
VVRRVVACGMDIVRGGGREAEAEAEVGGNATTVLRRGGLLPAPGFIKRVFIVELVVHVIDEKPYLSTRHRRC